MNGKDKIIVSIDISDKTINILDYYVDFKSNILGPEDFAVVGDTVYILNSSDNTVLEFLNGRYMRRHYVGFMQGIKIAAFGKFLYVLRNDFSILRISDTAVEIMALYNVPSEAIVDFMAIGENIYIVISDTMGGTTYEFSFDIRGIDINSAKKYHGRIFDENTLYTTEIFYNENGKGSRGKVTVTDLKSGSTSEIPVNTDFYITGIQYFGIDTDGITYLKIYEMTTNSVRQAVYESRLQSFDKQLQVRFVRSLSDQYKYVTNQEKSIDGNFYALNNFEHGVEVVMLSKPDENSTREYISELDRANLPPIPQEITDGGSKTTITREQIMKNAASFHSEFNWSCTEVNLWPLRGWVPPHYVKGPGNYKYMPYCWGGNCTAEEFYMGLANGGRVGNINAQGPAILPNTFGHDCSGFVGLCWGETQKYSTNTIQNIANVINSEDLKPGDALDRPFYHIVLFEGRDNWGNYVLYESTLLNQYDRVAHTLRPIASMGKYIPLRYKNVTDSNIKS